MALDAALRAGEACADGDLLATFTGNINNGGTIETYEFQVVIVDP